MRKPIFYWVKSQDGLSASIYLVGNPMVWWSSSLSVVLSVILLAFKKIRKKLSPGIYLLLVGYLVNLLPFVAIHRVAFLYHYLTSLVFAILILAFIVEKSLSIEEMKEKKWKKEKIEEPKRNKKIYLTLYFAALGLTLISFLVIAPITYGLFMPTKQAAFYSKFTSFLH